MGVIVLNFIAYTIWFCIAYKQENKLTAYSSMILMNVGIAFCSIIILNNGIYEADFGKVDREHLASIPYLLCFICYLMLFAPLRKLRFLDVGQYDIFRSTKLKVITKVLIVAYLIYLVIRIIEIQQGLEMGLAEVYVLRHQEGVVVFEHSFFIELFVSFMSTIDVIATPALIFYAIVGQRKKVISTIKAIFIIMICFLPNIVSSIAKGSRGGIFLNVICILFFVVIFYKRMSSQLKRSFFQVIIGMLVLGTFYAWLITIARNEGSGRDPLEGIYRYFGEPFLNLGHLFWGHVKAHPNGARLFDRIYNQFPSDWTRSDIYMYWWDYTGVPNYNFKTIFGDFYYCCPIKVRSSIDSIKIGGQT